MKEIKISITIQMPEKEAGTKLDFSTSGLLLASLLLQVASDNPELVKDFLPLIDNFLTLFEGRQKQTSQLSERVSHSPQGISLEEFSRTLKSVHEFLLQRVKESGLNSQQEAEKKSLNQSHQPPFRSRLHMNFNERTEKGGKNDG